MRIRMPLAPIALVLAVATPAAACAPPKPPVPISTPIAHPGSGGGSGNAFPLVGLGLVLLGVLLSPHHPGEAPASLVSVTPIPPPTPAPPLPSPASPPVRSSSSKRLALASPPPRTCRTVTPGRKAEIRSLLLGLSHRNAKDAATKKAMKDAFGACNISSDEVVRWVDPERPTRKPRR